MIAYDIGFTFEEMVAFLNAESVTTSCIFDVIVDEENEITINDIYIGMRSYVGVYTYNREDAELLADVAIGTQPDKAEKINYYDHYHIFIPNGNNNARLHIWYGLPFAGNEV